MNSQIAQTLEDAADFILVNGLSRGSLSDFQGRYCAVGAIHQVADTSDDEHASACAASKALEDYLIKTGQIIRPWQEGMLHPVAAWSDASSDDFEVIDALRLCAKDIRNTASDG